MLKDVDEKKMRGDDLGIWVSHTLATMMKGKIEILTDDDKNSTSTLQLTIKT